MAVPPKIQHQQAEAAASMQRCGDVQPFSLGRTEPVEQKKDARGLWVADDPGRERGAVGRRKADRFPRETDIGRDQREDKPDGMDDPRGADDGPEKAGPQQAEQAAGNFKNF